MTTKKTIKKTSKIQQLKSKSKSRSPDHGVDLWSCSVSSRFFLFLLVSSLFSRLFQFIILTLHQEFGTDCLGLVLHFFSAFQFFSNLRFCILFTLYFCINENCFCYYVMFVVNPKRTQNSAHCICFNSILYLFSIYIVFVLTGYCGCLESIQYLSYLDIVFVLTGYCICLELIMYLF